MEVIFDEESFDDVSRIVWKLNKEVLEPTYKTRKKFKAAMKREACQFQDVRTFIVATAGWEAHVWRRDTCIYIVASVANFIIARALKVKLDG